MTSIVDLIRGGALDAELGALLWALGDGGVPLHVAAPDADLARSVAEALTLLPRDRAEVSWGGGAAVEDVLRQPVPLRPAVGVVLVLDREGRVVAAHFLRPPLRDAGGHVRSQAPAVLAAWDQTLGAWEHFAWGVLPELAAAANRRAGDLEIEIGRRREFLEALVATGVDGDRVAAALAGYGFGARG